MKKIKGNDALETFLGFGDVNSYLTFKNSACQKLKMPNNKTKRTTNAKDLVDPILETLTKFY